MRAAPDARLAFRLVRGAGRRDITRLIAMTVGVAFAIFSALVGIAAPRVVSAAGDVQASRTPVWSATPTRSVGLRMQTSNATLGDEPWTRVTVSGTGPTSPLPPGVFSWPTPGLTVVSPALRHLAVNDKRVAGEIGPMAPGAIGRDGLTGPDELFSYAVTSTTISGVRSPGHDRRQSVITSFGNAAGVDSGGSTFLLAIEITILVLTPAILFLVTSLRLSAVSRARRSFSLGLVGMSPTRTARLYAWEMTLVAIVGFVLGAGAYEVLEGWIGTSGLLGIRWWPEQGRLGWVSLAIACVLAVALVRVVARRSMRAAATRSRSQGTQLPARLTAWLAFLVGVPATGFLVAVNVRGLMHPSQAWATDGFAAAIAVAVVASVAAVVLGVPRLVASLGHMAANRANPAFALGLRGAALRIASGRRLIGFVACAIMLAGLSSAFISSLQRSAFGDPAEATITVDLAGLRASRDWVAELPKFPYTVDTSLHGDGGTYSVVIGDCRAVEREAAVVFDQPGQCTDHVQRASGGIGGAGARSISVPGHSVQIPPTQLDTGFTWDVKFPLGRAPWLTDLTAGSVTFWVSRKDDSYQTVLAQLAQRFPNLQVDAGLKDAPRYGVYRQQVGTVRAAATLGIWLSVCSFLLTALEGRWERARSVAALAALGTPARVLRTANAVEFTFPIIVAVVPASAIGILGGWSVLSFWGTVDMFSGQIPTWTLVGFVASVLIAAVTGWATGNAVFQREALADT